MWWVLDNELRTPDYDPELPVIVGHRSSLSWMGLGASRLCIPWSGCGGQDPRCLGSCKCANHATTLWLSLKNL